MTAETDRLVGAPGALFSKNVVFIYFTYLCARRLLLLPSCVQFVDVVASDAHMRSACPLNSTAGLYRDSTCSTFSALPGDHVWRCRRARGHAGGGGRMRARVALAAGIAKTWPGVAEAQDVAFMDSRWLNY